jgi:hypothetical protein
VGSLASASERAALALTPVRTAAHCADFLASFDGVRRFVDQGFNSLTTSWLRLSENPSTGSGGTCFGDSGGPHFLGDSGTVVALTVTGDSVCRATDVDYRLDTPSARDFLRQFVTLP